jgi:hypothetical protein
MNRRNFWQILSGKKEAYLACIRAVVCHGSGGVGRWEGRLFVVVGGRWRDIKTKVIDKKQRTKGSL